MITSRTPKTRARRIGIWATPLLAVVALIVLFTVGPLMPEARGASDSLAQQLEQKVAAAEQANAAYQALVKELESLQKESDTRAANLAQLDEQITGVQNDIDQAEVDLDALRTQLEQRLVKIYKDGGSWSVRYLEALVAEENLTDIFSIIDMLSDLAGEDDRLFTEVESYLERVQDEQDSPGAEEDRATVRTGSTGAVTESVVGEEDAGLGTEAAPRYPGRQLERTDRSGEGRCGRRAPQSRV